MQRADFPTLVRPDRLYDRSIARSMPRKLSRGTSEPTVLSAQGFAERYVLSIRNQHARQDKIALIIPAYNESLVIAHTIKSAIASGLNKKHIFVVNDSSDDATYSIAASLLGEMNVFTVEPSGKGLAIQTLAQKLYLTERYRWIHIADADGEFDKRYFVELRKNLRVKYAAATGYVSSLDGGYISKYRMYEYTIGMDVVRRFQSIAGVISIIPGPTSIFRSDVFTKLDFGGGALCEDFDVTLQIHRQKLGSIQFIPSAIARTQDPSTFKDFIKQISRWNRGVLQLFFKHKVGRKASKIDTYLSYQMIQNLTFFLMYTVWVPFVTAMTGSMHYLALVFLSDVIILFGFTLFAAGRLRQPGLVGAFPAIYVLRWVSLAIFIRSFVEVALLRKYRITSGRWETVARRRQAAIQL